MTDERPLHVRVAEALGWTELFEREGAAFPDAYDTGPVWFGHPHPNFLPWYMQKGEPYKYVQVPRYDNWQDVGPIIERLKIDLTWYRGRPYSCLTTTGYSYANRETDPGTTALEAICHMLLRVDEAGELAALLKGEP